MDLDKIDISFATLKEEMLRNLQLVVKNQFTKFYDDMVMQIRLSLNNQKIKLTELENEFKQDKDMKGQVQQLLFSEIIFVSQFSAI